MGWSRPSPDIGASCPIAVIEPTEFPIPVVQSAKVEYDLCRLLCSGCCRSWVATELNVSAEYRSLMQMSEVLVLAKVFLQPTRLRHT